MSYALPCISTQVGDCKSILNSNEAIISGFDKKSIASKLIEFISKDSDELSKIGATNRDRILQNYSLNQVSQMYIDLYENICHEQRR